MTEFCSIRSWHPANRKIGKALPAPQAAPFVATSGSLAFCSQLDYWIKIHSLGRKTLILSHQILPARLIIRLRFDLAPCGDVAIVFGQRFGKGMSTCSIGHKEDVLCRLGVKRRLNRGAAGVGDRCGR